MDQHPRLTSSFHLKGWTNTLNLVPHMRGWANTLTWRHGPYPHLVPSSEGMDQYPHLVPSSEGMDRTLTIPLIWGDRMDWYPHLVPKYEGMDQYPHLVHSSEGMNWYPHLIPSSEGTNQYTHNVPSSEGMEGTLTLSPHLGIGPIPSPCSPCLMGWREPSPCSLIIWQDGPIP